MIKKLTVILALSWITVLTLSLASQAQVPKANPPLEPATVGLVKINPISEPALVVKFEKGHVFAAVSNGQVQHYDAVGNLLETLDCGFGGYTTGMAFDGDDDLYVTEFSNTYITIFSGPDPPHTIL